MKQVTEAQARKWVWTWVVITGAFPGGSEGKESTRNAGDLGSTPGLGSFPGGGTAPTPVFLPGESQGQRSLADYIVHGVRKSETTEWPTLS